MRESSGKVLSERQTKTRLVSTTSTMLRYRLRLSRATYSPVMTTVWSYVVLHQSWTVVSVSLRYHMYNSDSFLGSVYQCQEAALTRRTAWRRSGGGVGLGPSGKQLHPATPELTAWREGPADSSQQSAEQAHKRHVISHVTYLRAVLVSGLIR